MDFRLRRKNNVWWLAHRIMAVQENNIKGRGIDNSARGFVYSRGEGPRRLDPTVLADSPKVIRG